ncbi:TetR family transcriptional regulator [Niveibacterium terrae]|uniref:TetR family transcriptional regulator n=1 Tax=Niveibacterium terrae TaxID=3373598 RepID=UPI003A8D0855
MAERKNPRISSRKQPKQARSNALVSSILEAALQVLAKEGAPRFTTSRVAERAGVSVGSIYQYFPNKAAILFRLQSEEWQRTAGLLSRILEEREKPPLVRLRALVHTFIRSECEEADMRVALHDAAPLYRDSPEAHEARSASSNAMLRFIEEVLPETPGVQQVQISEIVSTTLGAVGKRFSESPRTDQQIDSYADAMADMLCAYLASHENPARRIRTSPRRKAKTCE